MDSQEKQTAAELLQIFQALDMSAQAMSAPQVTLEMIQQMRKVISHGLKRAEWLAKDPYER